MIRYAALTFIVSKLRGIVCCSHLLCTYGSVCCPHLLCTQAAQELHLRLRLPPLHPKHAAEIKRMVAGMGHLFAGPAGSDAQLLHFQVDLNPQGVGPKHCAAESHAGCHQADGIEDWDSAPATLLRPTLVSSSSSSKGSKVSCLLLDHVSGRLWSGCDDGRVNCWRVAPVAASGGPLEVHWAHSWLAHNGKVKCMALTPWGRLYTGEWCLC
jgi:hypothetical protein